MVTLKQLLNLTLGNGLIIEAYLNEVGANTIILYDDRTFNDTDIEGINKEFNQMLDAFGDCEVESILAWDDDLLWVTLNKVVKK